MYVLTTTIRENPMLNKLMTRRGFTKTLKYVLKLAMVEYHRRFVKRHFERKAYSLYGLANITNAPKKWKQRKGRPMLQSGTMRRRILKSKSLSDVRGTSHRVRMKMRYGRPPRRWNENDPKIKGMIFSLMHKHKIGYDAARAKFYSAWGYRQSKQFQAAFRKPHQSEINALRKFIVQKLVEIMSKPSPKRKRRIKAA